MLRNKLTLSIILLYGSVMAFASLQSQELQQAVKDLKESAGSPSSAADSIAPKPIIADENPDYSKYVYNDTTAEYTDSLDIGAIPTIDLDEFVVTSVVTPVVAKQDTLEFNAGSFKTATNANVEDLLKRLPGVEVGSDGSITSGGKKITKILVDGKEFFADDPQLATKNLPSNMVDKVQVIDRKSDLARLTGVDDGDDETVINLQVKKNMNNGWFGNVSAGYSLDNRYQASAVVNRFFNGNQITLIAGGNNINEMGFGDMGRGRFSMFGNNGGILTSQRFGLNFNVGNEEKFRVGGNIFYSHSDRDSRSRSETQYLFPDSTSYNKSGSVSRDKSHSVRADLRMQWNIDENNTFEFRPRFSVEFRTTTINDSSRLNAGDPLLTLVNRNMNARNNKGISWETRGELVYNHKFSQKPGRSMSAMLNYSYSDTHQKSTTWSDIEYLLKIEDNEELLRYLDSRQWSNTIEGRLTWTEPLGDPTRGNFMDFAYKASYRFNNADKLTYRLDPESYVGETSGNIELPEFKTAPEGAEYDASLSNRFRNNYFTQELQVGYKKVSKTLNLNVGLLFAPSFSSSTDLIDSRKNIPTRWVWNVGPYARIRYKFNDATSLNVRYRSSTTQPSLTALQPVEDVSDPLNIVKGNPDLKPTFTQNVNVMFNNYNSEHQQSIAAFVNASYALNSVVQRTVTDPTTGGRTTTYSNANGNLNIFGMGFFSRVLPNKRFSFNARLNVQYLSSPGYINGDFNRTDNLGLGPAAGITFTNDWLQASVNPTYNFGLVTNSLPNQPSRITHSYGFNADVVATLPFGLQISTDLAFSDKSGYSAGYDAASWLWNAQISYSFLKDKQLTAFVKAYDILGLNKNISRTTSANTIVDSEVNNLSRYVMVGLTWNFNTLKKNAGGNNGDFDHPGPPGGGGDFRRGRGSAGRPMGRPPR